MLKDQPGFEVGNLFAGCECRHGVPVQPTNVRYIIRVQGDGSREQVEARNGRVRRYSPNYNAFTSPVRLELAALEILEADDEDTSWSSDDK